MADFRALKLPLRFIGAGVFREAYRIVGFDLVVKFPQGSYGQKHNVTEARRIARLSRFRYLRKHLPKIHYLDPKGVMVMRYYENAKRDWDSMDAMGELIEKLIYKATGVDCSDIHGGNCGLRLRGDETPELILLDLGY